LGLEDPGRKVKKALITDSGEVTERTLFSLHLKVKRNSVSATRHRAKDSGFSVVVVQFEIHRGSAAIGPMGI